MIIVTEIIENGLIYALTGAFAGLMAGILGIGGGMIVVPALFYIYSHNNIVPSNIVMHMAAGSSLAIMIFTSQASIRAHHKKGGILWKIYQRLWPGVIIGTIIGAIVADLLPTYWLKILFGLFLLIIALKMLSDIHVAHPHSFPKPWVNLLTSTVIGFKSGLLGVGGGALIIPYLTYCGVRTRKIAAISALCTLTVATIGTIAFMITGSNASNLPSYSTGYVYWPAVLWIAIPSALFAPVGAQLTYVLPVRQLKIAFIAILFLTAIDLLV